jgi:hypothetical protein
VYTLEIRDIAPPWSGFHLFRSQAPLDTGVIQELYRIDMILSLNLGDCTKKNRCYFLTSQIVLILQNITQFISKFLVSKQYHISFLG